MRSIQNSTMKFLHIAPNMYLSDNTSFGNYNRPVVHELLASIDVNFSSALNTTPFSSCDCFIDYSDKTPMCCQLENGHYIVLSTSENYWCQWIYQFSHEYCHHLINGKLSGELSGLMWFEESICHLSSMYHLFLIHVQWSQSPDPTKSHFAPLSPEISE